MLRKISLYKHKNSNFDKLPDVNHINQNFCPKNIFLVPPEIIELNAEKRNLSKGDALKLSCKASGFPKPKIVWTKKGDSSAILGYEEVYEKVQVDENDGGDYVCTATNENLPDARKTINVNVFCKKYYFLFPHS